ncbi:hypothetical protein QE422_000472 [Chryseobacterium sp. SORGH_AS 447]|uniref:hypothetical protein n=1 Tax=Chryseobacterium sp. SORGH_AS_0447 TaxID=3041769 RepID=UPI0027878F42|nr:hypothetical protein [Chryseobacterium sp. SORGH_AS_0447]MDQ1160104.1 hypothetical protein [Chryseobacterium sp. SORGH_AS_0447]
MKKLLLLAAGLTSYFTSAQALHMQNLSKYNIEFTIWKSNLGSPSTGCTPLIESKLVAGTVPILPASPDPGNIAVEAYYEGNVNLSNTFNPLYPDTPLIDGWIFNGTQYNLGVNPPQQIPVIFSNVTTWTGSKFYLRTPAGDPIGGFTMFIGCGGPSNGVPNVSSSDPAQPFNGTVFMLGGDTWMIFY